MKKTDRPKPFSPRQLPLLAERTYARNACVECHLIGEPVSPTVQLPALWWWTDLRFRQSSVEPRVYFDSVPLSEADKHKYGLKPDGFASEVRNVDQFALITKSHDLKVGDIVFGVDGVEQDDLASSANEPTGFCSHRSY